MESRWHFDWNWLWDIFSRVLLLVRKITCADQGAIGRRLGTQIGCWPELQDTSCTFFLECLSGLGLGREYSPFELVWNNELGCQMLEEGKSHFS